MFSIIKDKFLLILESLMSFFLSKEQTLSFKNHLFIFMPKKTHPKCVFLPRSTKESFNEPRLAQTRHLSVVLGVS